MRYRLSTLLVLTLLAQTAFGQQPQGSADPLAPSLGERTFAVDSDLVEKIYRSLPAQPGDDGGGGYVMVQLGAAKFRDFVLANEYFTTDYAAVIDAMPALNLTVASRLYHDSILDLCVQGNFGYFYRQGSLQTESVLGSDVQHMVTIQAAPFGAGLAATLPALGLPFVTPGLHLGGGLIWAFQSGTIDGFDQSFTLPYYNGGLDVVLFGGTDRTAFDGISVAADFREARNETNRIASWTYSLGTKVKL